MGDRTGRSKSGLVRPIFRKDLPNGGGKESCISPFFFFLFTRNREDRYQSRRVFVGVDWVVMGVGSFFTSSTVVRYVFCTNVIGVCMYVRKNDVW